MELREVYLITKDEGSISIERSHDLHLLLYADHPFHIPGIVLIVTDRQLWAAMYGKGLPFILFQAKQPTLPSDSPTTDSPCAPLTALMPQAFPVHRFSADWTPIGFKGLKELSSSAVVLRQ